MPYLLCTPSQKHFFEAYLPKILLVTVISIITDIGLYEGTFSALISESEPILIDVECSFDAQPLSDFHGFDLALDLRRKYKVKNPIIFLSTFSQYFFEKKSLVEAKYKILFGKGTSFIQYPFSSELFESIVKNTVALTASSLHDVITSLCDLKGIVLDKLNHNLRPGCDIEAIFDEIAPFLDHQHKVSVSWFEYKNQLIELNDHSTEGLFYDIKQAFLSICSYQLTEQGAASLVVQQTRFKVLVVDDVAEELIEISGQLSPYFDLITTSSSTEAIEILENDTANEVVAVLSDWRLYKDAHQTYWQSYQGYEILEIASQKGIRTLYALTSQADYIVHQLRNIADYRFTLLKKQNLRTLDQWHLLIEMIQEACENVTQIIASMPESANWTNEKEPASYKNLYIAKRQSTDGKAFFDKVYSKADEVWDYILNEKEKGFTDLQYVKERFGLEIAKNRNDLFTVMVLRLLWIGLWNLLEEKSNEAKTETIYKIICTSNYDRGITMNHVNVELNKLCFTTKDLKVRRMLPEEKVWLQKCVAAMSNAA